jgi:hypothetical protein
MRLLTAGVSKTKAEISSAASIDRKRRAGSTPFLRTVLKRPPFEAGVCHAYRGITPPSTWEKQQVGVFLDQSSCWLKAPPLSGVNLG